MTPFSQLPLLRRPRERLYASGVGSLELEELLAVLLRTGSKGNDVLTLSERIRDALLSGRSSVEELAAIPGVGPSKASIISAALELSRSLKQRSSTFVLSDPERIFQGCQDLLSEPQEHLVVFFLTIRNQQIARETISIGTATASLVHPREVFRPAITHNASHLILAHNHPSGDPTPSQADREATLQLARAGKQVGIEVLDHVICAKDGYVSIKAIAPELFF